MGYLLKQAKSAQIADYRLFCAAEAATFLREGLANPHTLLETILLKGIMMRNETTSWTSLALLPMLFCVLVLSGCADSLVDADHSDELETELTPTDGKLRHAHLLDRALKQSAGKSMSGQQLNLIVKLSEQGTIEKQRVLERYRVIERYRVLERYEYSTVFEGWAWEISDSTGQNDYYALLDELAQDDDILWFEPDFDITIPEATISSGQSGQMTPWSVAAIGGQQSWAESGNGEGTVDVDIYVLDTGVAQANNNDGNDDLHLRSNIDFRPGFNDAKDYDGHGTHVAGIAAAVDDHDRIVGVAPGARIHNYKVLDDNGSTDVSVVIAAVEHITAEKLANPSKPMVVNMSLGEDIGTTNYTALDEAIEASINAGIVYVVAAGNQGKNANKFTPAHVSGVITVGSYDMNGRFSSFSNWGPMVDILAPGRNIVSLSPGSTGIVEMSGTSMSAAHVSGAVALLLGVYPSATPAQVRDVLVLYSRPIVQGMPNNTTNKSLWVGVDANGVVTSEFRVDEGTDDAEEYVDGRMYLNSSDLELGFEGSSQQTVGIRFSDTGIPQGATITKAYIQFTIDESNEGTAQFMIRGEDTNDAAPFSSAAYNITLRQQTSASVAWAPFNWTQRGESIEASRTPDLKNILQEMVNRSGWASDDLAFIITGSGERTAESFEGDSNAAPLLHVEWHY